MLHVQMRQARIAAQLTVSDVARLAGVPRKQVQALESGKNVTLATVRQIAAVIPNLKRVTLGGLDIDVANVDLEEARKAALDLFDVAKRLVAALSASPASDAPPPAARAVRSGGAGAERYEAGMEISPEKARELEQLVDDIQARKRRPPKDHA